MATITTDTYLDDAARTAGEAWTINSGATLTVRTDSRVHAYAPASNLGSLGSVTINEGSMVWDSTAVRVVPFDTGSGNVPAIGTSITQGGVSGYLLGVWPDWASAQTAVGAAMPTTGFLKFREVTGGAFAVGALTGIGASATGISVQGWIEIVMDTAANMTVPRLGSHLIRGGRFYIGVTDGTVGQTFQTPSMGSTLQVAPGAYIENSPGSANADADYEFWQGLNGTANGWNHPSVGGPFGATDIRQAFLKSSPSGTLQIGEAWEQSATYASFLSGTQTYNSHNVSGVYVWSGDTVYVYISSGHVLKTGDQTGLDFTSGGGVDGVYTVNVLSPYHFTVPLSGSGTGGNVTSRMGFSINYNTNIGAGDNIYLSFSTGSMVGNDGFFTSYLSTTANACYVTYPHTSALTSGNAVMNIGLTVSATAHGLDVGQHVYLDFSSGEGVDGIYAITTKTTDTFAVVHPLPATTSGNVTVKRTIGHIPPSGCRVWIPSTVLTECATADRAVNVAPNATLASRPEWITTNGGLIDFEYLYANSGYLNFTQAFSIKLKNSACNDTLVITTTPSAIDLDSMQVGMASGYSGYALFVAAAMGGGAIKNAKYQRGSAPSYQLTAMRLEYCVDVICDNVQSGAIQYARNTAGYSSVINYCVGVKLNGCRLVNSPLRLVVSIDSEIIDIDYTDRYNGMTNSVSVAPVLIEARCDRLKWDGMTFGFGGTILNNHPGTGLFSISASGDCVITNLGTKLQPLNGGTFLPQVCAMGRFASSIGNNTNIKVKRCYAVGLLSYTITTSASDRGMIFENCGFNLVTTSGYITALSVNASNAEFKGIIGGSATSTGQSSVYGSHYIDMFHGDYYGRLTLCMNEPTLETSPLFSMISGVAKFNSSGGILMGTVGMRAEWEDSCFRLGHTGFENIGPTMTGGTIGNYTLEYKIDTGSGYSAWKTMSGANLSAETIDPSIGFKMKWAIETTTANTTAITFLSVSTLTTAAAQENLYPLDIITLTIPGLVTGSDVVIYNASTGAIIDSVDAYSGTSWSYVYETPTTVDIGVFKSGYVPKYIRNYTLLSTDATLPNVAQVSDRNYA